jgi:hypothetical protein
VTQANVAAAPSRDWRIEVSQGDIKIGLVEVLQDTRECKVFIVRPKDESGFALPGFYAHGACYAVLLGTGLRGKETQVAVRIPSGGWHSFVHAAGNGLIWTLCRWATPEKVWPLEDAAS